MKKLKLEALEITSFDTTSGAARQRGTVLGHAPVLGPEPEPTGPFVGETYNVELCGDSAYFDCTFGCSNDTCPSWCLGYMETDLDCPEG